MGRGAYVPSKHQKFLKTAQVDASSSGVSSAKPDWRTSIRSATFPLKNSSKPKVASSVPDQVPPSSQEIPCQQESTADVQMRVSIDSVSIVSDLTPDDETQDPLATALLNELKSSERPTISRTSSMLPSGGEETGTYEAELDTFDSLSIEETQSSTSSIYSADSSSIYSRDSTSIYSSASSVYSSASSVYSSGASIYSFDDRKFRENERYANRGSTELIEEEETGYNASSRLPNGSQLPQRARTAPARRREPQDAASRESSALAKKAARFKNSKLPPQLPVFNTSLPTWSMICRAARASQDCYDSQALTRRGTYTPANSSKDMKAMIVDDQLIDDTRIVIVAVRGTECKSLADWVVNKDAKPVKPVGFLDDEENACHAGFLQVTRAMVDQVAAQLKQHPALDKKPSLLFTGHSAGGAVAAMLYSHMLSTSVQSDLTSLASQFPSINCVTFGAPPLSFTPLPKRDHGIGGIFYSFASEGDPILRISDAAYVKTLAKLITASFPVSAAPPKVKVVRRSRGTSIIREIVSEAPPLPWEERPLWPTPPGSLTNAGEVILLRDDKENGGSATCSLITHEDLSDVIFGDFSQHPIGMYIRRVKELSLTAMTGRIIN